MKAPYVMESAKGYTRVEGTFFGGLPVVVCEVCSSRRGAFEVSFPCIDGSALPKGSLLKWRTYRDLNMKQYLGLMERIQASLGHSVVLVPNASIGPFTCKLLQGLDNLACDLEWAAPGGPLLRKSFAEKLRAKGFSFNTIEAVIRKGKKITITDYVFLQPDILPILDQSRLAEQNCTMCGTCGEVLGVLENPVLLKDAVSPLPAFFRVKSVEDYIFLSPRMADELLSLQPSGMELRQFGSWS